MKSVRALFLALGFCLLAARLAAHPVPNSLLLLDVKSEGVLAELSWPLNELQAALPGQDITAHSGSLLQRLGSGLKEYLQSHFYVTDTLGRRWEIEIRDMKVLSTRQELSGKYEELRFVLWLRPPAGSPVRRFTAHYDAIMHQVVTHRMLVSVRQDWDNGLTGGESAAQEPGLLMMDLSDNRVHPIEINLDEGSRWKGFRAMVSLGMDHIAEGSDHLLFLFVLLLAAPLVAAGGRWTGSGGTRYGLIRLLKIATAFTVGHSLTLLAGALGWLRLPSQPIEVLIAFSILVGAVHAVRPLFPGREVFVAGGFGLVHGLAFAGTLSNLHLDGGRMALSILGFNLGIELMQLFIIFMVVPWLIILSPYPIYKWVRSGGALLAGIAAIAWITERISGKANAVAAWVQRAAEEGRWLVLMLAILAVAVYLASRRKVRAEV